jgi:hypothetical protein
MTDFLSKLTNSAKQAQSDRRRSQSQKKLLPPFATYQGKDPVDGTDRVAINGVTTSGYKLISNAPLSIGERVYLRPNTTGGLQRVDARNRPIISPVADVAVIPEFKTIIFSVLARSTAFLTIDNNSDIATGFNLPDLAPNFIPSGLSQEELEAQYNDLWAAQWTDPLLGLPTGYKYDNGVIAPDLFFYSVPMEIFPTPDSGIPTETYTAQSAAPYYVYGLEIGCTTDYSVRINLGAYIFGSDIAIGDTYEFELMVSEDGGAYAGASSYSGIAGQLGNIPSMFSNLSPATFTSGDPFNSCTSYGSKTFNYYIQWRKQGKGWFEL